MVGKRQFSMRYLLGLVAAIAASLVLTKFLLLTLSTGDEEPWGWICLLFSRLPAQFTFGDYSFATYLALPEPIIAGEIQGQL